MARRGSALAALLASDVLLLGALCLSAAFLPSPAVPRMPTASARLSPGAAAAAVAATQFAAGAEAVEKWTYKEPSGELSGGQAGVLLLFFFVHAAGVADFYSKKNGGGPAVPINPFRSQQFLNTGIGPKEIYKVTSFNGVPNGQKGPGF
eukprot:CAMPEP_0117485272 /NCGR_PEP_ID=MMETSP0784-20121206/14882_1 /TAXON_ID=39447 /ORGANISM="" /LENGTH=148 /DNA_ID=CAMNT_0005279859 /DNA_START=58 /DNA_END=504 /DNA_ORIENTATION=-